MAVAHVLLYLSHFLQSVFGIQFFARGSDVVQCIYFIRLGFLVVSRVVSDDWKAVSET
jgi:hypothetical protein